MTDETQKSAGVATRWPSWQPVRRPDGRFAPGSGGRPRGARGKATRLAQELLDGEAERLTRRAVELALQGDPTALRLCVERISPPPKDRALAVPVRLPPLRTVDDGRAALAEVARALASGEIAPSEAAALTGVVRSWLEAASAVAGGGEVRITWLPERADE